MTKIYDWFDIIIDKKTNYTTHLLSIKKPVILIWTVRMTWKEKKMFCINHSLLMKKSDRYERDIQTYKSKTNAMTQQRQTTNKKAKLYKTVNKKQ